VAEKEETLIPQSYSELSDLDILALAVWREARGEQSAGQRAVAHVIRNRTLVATWWNGNRKGSYHAVILQPYQFSSFNPGDPNADKWPSNDLSFTSCREAALWVPCGMDPDNTDGATSYYDISITFPAAWGPEADWINTANYGRLRFWKPKTVV
jgi:hypothetical protein